MEEMNTRTRFVVMLFILLLLGAAVVGLQRLYGKKTYTVGSDNFKASVETEGGWLTESGYFFAFLSESGEEVEGFDFTISYTVTGKELNWETLTVHCTINVTVKSELAEKTEQLLSEESHEKSGSFSVAKNMSYFVMLIGVNKIPNGTVVHFFIDVLFVAECYDIYAAKRVVEFPAYSAQSFTWVDPEIGIITDVPPESDVDEYKLGWDKGYAAGYSAGQRDALAEQSPKYTAGDVPDYGGNSYSEGYDEGYITGYVRGYSVIEHSTDYDIPATNWDHSFGGSHPTLIPYAVIGRTDGGSYRISVMFIVIGLVAFIVMAWVLNRRVVYGRA